MNNAYAKCVGKKFKSIHIVTNIAGRKELHAEFTRRINGTTGIIIENTKDLYNMFPASISGANNISALPAIG